MNGVTPCGIYADSYCSRRSAPLPSFLTLQERFDLFIEILNQPLLCRHDVKKLNTLYRQMDLLERQIEPIPINFNSSHALQAIVEKIQKIMLASPTEVQDLISLYYLRQFSDQGLQIDRSFCKVKERFQGSQKEVVSLVPLCDSEEAFDADSTALLSAELSHSLKMSISIKKRKKLQCYLQLKKTILKEKEEFRKLREENPTMHYPAYLDELLDKGYLHLYYHLMKVRNLSDASQRNEEIEKMTFSETSHVVLEAREAIIRKVTEAIPSHSNNILFLLGESGAGKSTTLCFLRGDAMTLRQGRYISQNAISGMIGHKLATSCTFLPHIEKIDGCFIVDFPGFDDTNGPIVSLGIECALKALVHQYNPQILLIESITNRGNRGQTASKLGERLSRILNNKQDCLLGITKYSQDPDFIELSNEKKIQKELKKLNKKENRLLAKIHISPEKKTSLAKKQKKLEKIKSEKEEIELKLKDLPQRKKSLAGKERLLLDQTGLKNFVPLYHLEASNRVNDILTILMMQKPAQVNSQHHLDPNDKQLLKDLFKTMQKKLETQASSFDISTFKSFEDRTFTSSLIQAICHDSNREIGHFLHLPEIDPHLVHEFDSDIVKTCITKFMKCIISTLALSSMDQALSKFERKGSNEKITQFRNHLKRLKDFIMQHLGRMKENEEQAQEEWECIKSEYRIALDANNNDFWIKARNYLSYLFSANTIKDIKDLYEHLVLDKQAIDRSLDYCIDKINLFYNLLQRLKVIEHSIEKQKKIKNAYYSLGISDISVLIKAHDTRSNLMQVSLLSTVMPSLRKTDVISNGIKFDSIRISVEDLFVSRISMQNRILAVSRAYGTEDWNSRVASLTEQLEKEKQARFDKKDLLHCLSVIIRAALLIDPELCLRDINSDWNDTYYSTYSVLQRFKIETTNNEIIIYNNKNTALHDFYGPFYIGFFKIHNKNRIARMMLADALLSTHPF